MRGYEEKRTENRHILEEHRSEVYDLIPGYKDIDSKISSLAIEQGKRRILGDEKALETLREDINSLSDKKKTLLKEYGFPEDYLSPVYTCPDCKDTGYISNQKCHCLKQAMIHLLYRQSNIESVLERENFDNFSFDVYHDSELEEMRAVYDRCKGYVRDFDDRYENILFRGSVGTGKTYLTNCIARELLSSGHSVIYFTAVQLFDTLAKYAFRASDDDEKVSDIHDDIFECDLLIIDDLGTEVTNSFVTSQLFLILNERDIRRRSTIISTNKELKDLSALYSERNFSRIFSKFEMIRPNVEDIRMRIKKNKA